MQQRYYDPVIGRFYSNDPVGFTASNPMMFNRYAYANNNPYKFVDPDGREVRAIYNNQTKTLSVRDIDTKERIAINAFSGGSYFHGDFEPIPEGRYAILFHPKETHYRLEAIDSKFGDDKVEGNGRSEFRLHYYGGGVSEGCIAASSNEEFGQVRSLLERTKTSTTSVDSKSFSLFNNKSSESSVRYGELLVVRGEATRIKKK